MMILLHRTIPLGTICARVLVALLCAGAEAQEGETLRILTYNIHHAEGTDGAIDLERLASVIRAVGPDVVCLQEADRNLPRTNHIDMPARFAELLGMDVVFEANYRFDGGEYGNATLTNLPIVHRENHALPGPPGAEPRGCLRVDVEFSGATISVFNTHWGLRPEERLEQAHATLALIEGRPHALVAGDLNATPESEPITVLRESLRDSLPTGAEESTSHTVRGRRIDYVLHTPSLRVLEASVVRNAMTAVASDHLPYWAELSLAPHE